MDALIQAWTGQGDEKPAVNVVVIPQYQRRSRARVQAMAGQSAESIADAACQHANRFAPGYYGTSASRSSSGFAGLSFEGVLSKSMIKVDEDGVKWFLQHEANSKLRHTSALLTMFGAVALQEDDTIDNLDVALVNVDASGAGSREMQSTRNETLSSATARNQAAYQQQYQC